MDVLIWMQVYQIDNRCCRNFPRHDPKSQELLPQVLQNLTKVSLGSYSGSYKGVQYRRQVELEMFDIEAEQNCQLRTVAQRLKLQYVERLSLLCK